jgi:hypothetical protein
MESSRVLNQLAKKNYIGFIDHQVPWNIYHFNKMPGMLFLRILS